MVECAVASCNEVQRGEKQRMKQVCVDKLDTGADGIIFRNKSSSASYGVVGRQRGARIRQANGRWRRDRTRGKECELW